MSQLEHRITRNLAEVADELAPSTPAWEALEQRLAAQVSDPPEMEITMLQKSPATGRTFGPTKWIVSIAAAALLIVGGIVLLGDDDPDAIFVGEPDPQIDSAERGGPTEPDTAEDLARAYLAARAAHDRDAATALFAPDAQTPVEGFGAASDFERALGFRYLDPVCSASSQQRAVCTYRFETALTAPLGFEPWEGNSTVIYVTDDGIDRAFDEINLLGLLAREIDQLVAWVEENHPDDLAVMFDLESTVQTPPPNLDPASIELWGLRVRQFVESLGDG